MLAGADAADFFHALGQQFFAALLRGVVPGAAAEGVGETIHVGYAVRFVVGVAVALAVVEFLHQPCWGVAEVERNGLLAGVLDLCLNRAPGGVDGVGLGREREIDDGLSRRLSLARAQSAHPVYTAWGAVQAEIEHTRQQARSLPDLRNAPNKADEGKSSTVPGATATPTTKRTA